MAEQEQGAGGEGDIVFSEDEQASASGISNPNILSLPVNLTVTVGKAQLTVRELMALTPESVIQLDAEIDDPAEIFIGDKLIGRGELVEPEGDKPGIGIRLVELCDKVA